jgi:hypothetical protein
MHTTHLVVGQGKGGGGANEGEEDGCTLHFIVYSSFFSLTTGLMCNNKASKPQKRKKHFRTCGILSLLRIFPLPFTPLFQPAPAAPCSIDNA